MYVLLIQTDIKPEHREAYLIEITAHARRSLTNEPGTVRFDVIADEHNVNRLYLYECYADLAAREAHGQGESIALFRAATAGWAEASTVLGRGDIIFPTGDQAQ